MFELTDTLIRGIIFAMENQDDTRVIDTEMGVLVDPAELPEHQRPREDQDELDPTARYQPLPPWDSAHGFDLMHGFLTELHNPAVRDTLNQILLSGNRVFRRFKDTLREHREIEKRYHRYKYMNMRRVVQEWYNMLRELSGLDIREFGADEELDGLILSDISIKRIGRVPSQLIVDWDEQAYMEAHRSLPQNLRQHLYRRRRKRYLPEPNDADSIIYGAWTPQEELCGFVWAIRERLSGSEGMLELHQLAVKEEYRGLGIARELLNTCLRDADQEGIKIFVARLPGMGPAAVRLMKDNGFELIREDYLLIR